jgi:hypothetical protein
MSGAGDDVMADVSNRSGDTAGGDKIINAYNYYGAAGPTTRKAELPPRRPFFGREKELAIIAEALDPKSNGWGVLIDGPGGIGKTALAIRAGHLASDQIYPTKIFLSAKIRELTPQDEQELEYFIPPDYMTLLTDLARELGDKGIERIHPSERPKEVRRLLENSHALIIIDNLETFDEKERERLFQFLMWLPRSCKAIVTSRRRDDVSAKIIRLNQLSMDTALKLIDSLAERNDVLRRSSQVDRQMLVETAGGNPLLITWVAGQLGRPSSQFRTVAQACESMKNAPAGDDPLDFIFGDLFQTFTANEIAVLAALQHFSEFTSTATIAQQANLSVPVAEMALESLVRHAILTSDTEAQRFVLPPLAAMYVRRVFPAKAIDQATHRLDTSQRRNLNQRHSQSLTYLDFELEIIAVGGLQYKVRVLHSPAGEAHEDVRFPFDKLALESQLKSLEIALLKSGGARRQVLSNEQQVVQEFGKILFTAIFTGEIRSRFDMSQAMARNLGKGLRLKLHIQAPDLSIIPWEFMFDPRQSEYICLSRNTPVVRYIDVPQVIEPLFVSAPLRVLGIVATPLDLAELNVAREKERLVQATHNLASLGLIELTWLERGTWRDLQKAMRGGPWHVFHFIGHGGFDRNADEGLIFLEDEAKISQRFTATHLGRLLADHQSLRLVVLNSCEGARGSDRDVFSSTASILVRRGIPSVIAMQYEITDEAAVEFSRSFYEALMEEMSVDAAVAEARKAISLAVNNTVEWGTPVLFMRSLDGMLFKFRLPFENGALPDSRQTSTAEAVNSESPVFLETINPEKTKTQPAVVSQSGLTLADVKEVWPQILEKLRAQSIALEAIMRNCKPIRAEGAIVTIGWTAEGLMQRFESSPKRKIVVDVLSTTLDRSCEIISVKIPVPTFESVCESWEEILQNIKMRSIPTEALLRNCKVLSVSSGGVTLEWPTNNLKARFEEGKHKRLFEDVISSKFNQSVAARSIVMNKLDT